MIINWIYLGLNSTVWQSILKPIRNTRLRFWLKNDPENYKPQTLHSVIWVLYGSLQEEVKGEVITPSLLIRFPKDFQLRFFQMWTPKWETFDQSLQLVDNEGHHNVILVVTKIESWVPLFCRLLGGQRRCKAIPPTQLCNHGEEAATSAGDQTPHGRSSS